MVVSMVVAYKIVIGRSSGRAGMLLLFASTAFDVVALLALVAAVGAIGCRC